MSDVIPPSSAPIMQHLQGDSDEDVRVIAEEEEERLPITEGGQICFERVLPSQAHYYKLPSPPKCTGKVRVQCSLKGNVSWYNPPGVKFAPPPPPSSLVGHAYVPEGYTSNMHLHC